MILIPVDEGYAFDYLAILQVKLEYQLVTQKEFDEFSGYMRKTIGYGAYSIITSSHEYEECVRVNKLVFLRVDDAKNDAVKASVVHNLNFERYKAKVALQKKFFPNSSVLERKN